MVRFCEEHINEVAFHEYCCPACLNEQLIEACGKLRRLNTIVDKLPKCWRLNEEGELVQDVPIIPLHNGYLIVDGEIKQHVVIEIRKPFSYRHNRHSHWLTMVMGPLGSVNALTHTYEQPEEFYDSRDAAEFALKQVNQEKLGGES